MSEAWQAFLNVARLPSEAIDLGRAALLLGAAEDPEVDVEGQLAALDRLAAAARRRLPREREPLADCNALSEYLFDEVGFRGNREAYYDPRNSYLHHVLGARAGIPITLSLVYIEVGRRLDLPLVGIGLPGHFLVGHRDVADLYVDPFHGGVLLSVEECAQRMRDATGPDVAWDPAHLAPVSHRDFLARMVRNLKAAYVRQRRLDRALRMIDWLIAWDPERLSERRDRGVVCARMGRRVEAVADLEAYLDAAPDAPDSAAVRELVERLRGGG